LHRKQNRFSFIGTPRPNDTSRAVSTLSVFIISNTCRQRNALRAYCRNNLSPSIFCGDVCAKFGLKTVVADAFTVLQCKMRRQSGEERVGLIISAYSRQIHSVGNIYKVFVKSLTAANKYLFVGESACKSNRTVGRFAYCQVFSWKSCRRHDYIDSVWKRAFDFFESICSHYHYIARRKIFESRHIFG